MDGIDAGMKVLEQADLIVGHNIIAFDIPAIKKVYPWFKPKGLVRDTLVLSRLIRADSKDHKSRDWKLVNKGLFPKNKKKLIGRHSLESWGYRLGIWKGDYAEIKEAEAKSLGIKDPKAIERYVWGTWNEEMQRYCETDVEVTEALWRHFSAKLDNGWSDETVDLEHETAWVIARQSTFGIKFNTQEAGRLYAKLVAHSERLTKELQKTFGPKTLTWTPKANNSRYGYKKGVPITKEIPFNPGSRRQAAERLQELGWKPSEYGKDGYPKVDDETLALLKWPQAKLLSEFYLVQKRIGTLSTGRQALMKHVGPDNIIHPEVISNGAVTGRMTHKVVVNIPGPIDKKTGKPQLYGQEFRDLFIPRLGAMVGCDADSLEGRVMGGYMAKYDGGAYSKSVISGNKKEGTDNHSRTRDAINRVLKKLFKLTIHRETTKTVFYALIYGAKDPKLGESAGVNGTKQKKGKIGAAIRSAVIKGIPGLEKLMAKLTAKVRKQGWIYGLDHRKLRIRKEDAALNTLFQSAGAILMKRGLIILDTELSGVKPSVIGTQGPEAATKLKPGTDYEFVLNYHDEWEIDCKKELAEDIGRKAAKAIALAGDYYNFKCPLAGNAKVGASWGGVH